MRKLGIAIVVVLIVIAVVAVIALSRVNTYLDNNREWLAQQASSAVGREIRFDEVGVSLLGGVGAEVTDVVIGDDPAFSNEPFLQVDRAVVAVKVLPALRGRYEVSKVVLEAPRVTVIRQDGGLNVESMGAGRGAGTRPAAGTAGAGGDGGPLPLVVSNVEISDGRLRYVDRTQSPPAELLVEQLDFSASDVGFDSAVDLDFAAAVLGATEQNLSVAGTLGPIGSLQGVSRAPVDLKARVGPVVINRAKQLPVVGDSIPPALSSDDPIDVRVDLGGTLTEPEVTASVDASAAALRYGDLFRKPKGTRLGIEAKVDRSADSIRVDDLVVELAEAKLQGGGSIGTGPQTSVDFQVTGRDIPLAGWGELFSAAEDLDVHGVVDVDVRAVGPLASGAPRLQGSVSLKDVSATQPGGGISISGLTTRVALQGDRVEIPPTQFQVAGQPVNMEATVTSLEKSTAEFSVTSPELSLAAIGAGGEGVAEKEVIRDLSVKGAVSSAQGEPQLRATVRSPGGSVRGVRYSDLDTEIGLAGEKANVRKLSVKAFDGLVTGSGSFAAGGKEPEFEFRGRVADLDVASILAYLGATEVDMTGKVEGDLQLRGSGANQQQVMNRLTGDGALAVENGVLKGVNIAETVLSSVTGVPGLTNLLGPEVRQKYPSIFSRSDTAFDALRGKTTIAGGAARLDEMLLSAPDYGLRGKGTVRFDNNVDIDADFVASGELSRQLRSDVKEVKYLLDSQERLVIPVRLTGSLPDVRPRPNTEYLAKQLTGALVSQGLDKGIGALLGERKREPAETAPAENQNRPSSQDTTEQLIRKGLEGLLGGGAGSNQ